MEGDDEMVNKGDYVVNNQQYYQVIAALGSAIYLLPVCISDIESRAQLHDMADIEHQYRKIEYVQSK